jgi:hypothetical protein
MDALKLVQKFYPNVTSVKDATKDLYVEVTGKDAASKAVRNHKECALAAACKRSKVADATIISVKTSYLIRGDVAIRYSTPQALAREIISFDRDAAFDPGEYVLKRPSPTSRLRSGRKYGPGIGKGPKPRFMHSTQGIRESLKTTK